MNTQKKVLKGNVKKKKGGNKIVPFLKKLIIPASMMALRYGTRKLASNLRKRKKNKGSKKIKDSKKIKESKKTKERVMKYAAIG